MVSSISRGSSKSWTGVMSTYLSVGLCRGGVNWRLAGGWAAAARVFPLVGISGGTGEIQGFPFDFAQGRLSTHYARSE